MFHLRLKPVLIETCFRPPQRPSLNGVFISPKNCVRIENLQKNCVRIENLQTKELEIIQECNIWGDNAWWFFSFVNNTME